MFDRIKRSFDLVRASARMLRQDTHLILFPVISALTMLLVVAAFVLPLFGVASIDGIGRGGVYSVAFLFYVVQYFVVFYFNVALVGAVMIRLDGGAPTLADGLRVANGRLGAILGYAVIAATVGVILRAIQERVGFIGRLIVGLIGASWTIATFLVVPVIVERNRGPIAAIAESADLLKITWGENLAGQAGIGVAFAAMYVALGGSVAVLGVLVFRHAAAVSPALMVAFAAVVALAVLAAFLAHATLSAIYSAVLYRYAVHGSDTPGFDGHTLGAAFQPKT
jgi:hypothetical protein